MNIVPIKDREGYFIADNGQVFCTLGKGNRRCGRHSDKFYAIKPRPGKTGYMRVCMRDQSTGKRKDSYVHRLVADHFIPNPDDKPCVNHKNCDRGDNRVENLEWMTVQENTRYTALMGHAVRNELGQYTTYEE